MPPPQLTGRVLWQGQPGYDDARKDYNGRLSVFPKGIVYCSKVLDIQNALQWARANHVRVSVRSGGHDYEAFSLAQGGLVIDVSPMNEIDVDTVNGRTFIYAGATLLPVYERLWQSGVTIPAGTCAGVGIAGHVLGGGFGLLARRHGLACDNLLGIQLVTADGQLVTATPQSHPDLLWACQGGGGGNFGVVTGLLIKTHPIGNVAIYSMSWPQSALRDALAVWQTWGPNVDHRLTSILMLPATSSGQGPSSAGMFLGSQDELNGLLQPLLDVGPPNLHLSTMPYLKAVEAFAGVNPRLAHLAVHRAVFQKTFKATSTFAFQPLSDTAIATLLGHLQSAPSAQNLLQLDAWGGAVSQLAPNATAFPHRSAQMSMHYQAYWQSPGEASANVQWIDSFRASMLSYVPNAAYRNYTDADLPNFRQAYYGGNLQRLMAVKKAYDPDDFFHYPQSIPEPPPPHLQPSRDERPAGTA